MNLESIVRPFQTPDNAPAKPFFTAGRAAPQNIILQFGRGGGGKVLNGSSSYTATFYMMQYVNEKSQAF
ncbi:hypothetical protein N2603_23335 [Bradyrhizobium huanghuaihaiense]|uniref:hypothetical protein n=1 Tax=Bradyrhizobium huanghuaihaiense TaxID=990078 RepID=UPI0021AA9940|nr:hypothetical protein [Bradyrhizobium sp. CB3035]UWU73040.1 hypothetical protein N2603_23335 [Bradyrhizobium sp. CB3035]